MNIWLINQFSYILIAAAVLGGMGIYFARNGLNARRGLALATVAVGFVIAWFGLRTGYGLYPQTAQAALVIAETRQPVLVEFYSDYCAGCLIAKPMLDDLEQDLAGQLQVLRLNVASPSGREIAAQLNVDNRTPTFVLLDPDGTEVWRSFGILDPSAVKSALAK
jgi:thiol-disulfide isomerase/thioredoxin